MKKLAGIGVMLTLSIILSGAALSQPRNDVWGSKGEYCRLYDPRTAQTVEGEVVEVRNFTPPTKGASGVRFTLKTNRGPIEVILGPSWYVATQNFVIAPHDQVTVTGSRVAVEGKATIIASEVSKGGRTWKLRHNDGLPVWSPQSGLQETG